MYRLTIELDRDEWMEKNRVIRCEAPDAWSATVESPDGVGLEGMLRNFVYCLSIMGWHHQSIIDAMAEFSREDEE